MTTVTLPVTVSHPSIINSSRVAGRALRAPYISPEHACDSDSTLNYIEPYFTIYLLSIVNPMYATTDCIVLWR